MTEVWSCYSAINSQKRDTGLEMNIMQDVREIWMLKKGRTLGSGAPLFPLIKEESLESVRGLRKKSACKRKRSPEKAYLCI